MGSSHYAQYGNTMLQRMYCENCRSWTLVIESKKQCCGNICTEESKFTKVIVPPQGNRIRLSRKVREMIKKEQDYKCYYCENVFGYYYSRGWKVYKSTIHFDHIVPFYLSCNNKKDNLVATCNLCNSIKGPKTFKNIEDLREYIQSVKQRKDILVMR
jgi:5-methylcytosine-specific restriction endonuclease McrA